MQWQRKSVVCWAQPTKPNDLQCGRRSPDRDRSRSAVCSRAPPIIRSRMNRGATGSPVAVLQSIAVAELPNLEAPAGATSTPRVSIVSPPPEGVSSPELVPSDRDASFPGFRQSRRQTASLRHVFRQATWPVSPFVDGSCARHHPSAPIRAATALQRTSRSSRSLLLGPHSQSAAFEAPVALATGTGFHPGSHRPSRFSHDRFSTWSRWFEGVTPHTSDTLYVRASASA